jgi:hypothetical protein
MYLKIIKKSSPNAILTHTKAGGFERGVKVLSQVKLGEGFSTENDIFR